MTTTKKKKTKTQLPTLKQIEQLNTVCAMAVVTTAACLRKKLPYPLASVTWQKMQRDLRKAIDKLA